MPTRSEAIRPDDDDAAVREGPPASGAAGEDAAVRALRRRGYRILARNLRTPGGEIDVVAERRGVLAFVEVKSRRAGGTGGAPEDAFTRGKMARVARAARHVLRSRGLADSPYDFLGIAVDLDTQGRPTDVRVLPLEEIR